MKQLITTIEENLHVSKKKKEKRKLKYDQIRDSNEVDFNEDCDFKKLGPMSLRFLKHLCPVSEKVLCSPC